MRFLGAKEGYLHLIFFFILIFCVSLLGEFYFYFSSVVYVYSLLQNGDTTAFQSGLLYTQLKINYNIAKTPTIILASETSHNILSLLPICIKEILLSLYLLSISIEPFVNCFSNELSTAPIHL